MEKEQNAPMLALAKHLDVNYDDIKASSYNDYTYEFNNEEYIVATDDQANILWENDLDNYLDECVLPELPFNLRYYFNEEEWKHDARFDGRGHSLNRYDGSEEEQTIKDVTYYIYRTN